ncbi:alanine racemase [Cyclonatronum proteinivorum]|uniref:Alanine racemase n=1 Tax=Cyclonatronum proteinivorum TaxID=1457365 RepID=A0A345ULV9_9BACT|nr:alanine racemase [Cyclonatronum proteinivorum]AXJ01461.1 alanine racemase [Cyclonatronum proteinivorum]
MFHSSFIELNKAAYQQNISFLRSRFGPDVRFSAVIKGNAYGHGIENILPMAEELDIRHFSVFCADEALKALNARTADSEIMIMGMIDDAALEWAVEHDVSFYVFELERVKAAVEAAKKLRKPARMHIELETGMYRTGFNREELQEALDFISDERQHLTIEGLCTHFAGAESVTNYLRVKNQMKAYGKLHRMVDKSGIPYRMCHTACSAAALRYPKTRMDMVRIGIAQYGLWPNRETYLFDVVERNGDETSENPLRRVISWKSRVMSTKTVPPNRFIGYGTTYLTNHATDIATVPVGYTHGFSRNLSNLGRVLVNGRRVPVIGLVNMNMMMVDVTGIEGVEKGSEVIIIGEKGGIDMTVGSFSELTNMLNYETLARLPEKIPRYII